MACRQRARRVSSDGPGMDLDLQDSCESFMLLWEDPSNLLGAASPFAHVWGHILKTS